MMLAFLDNATLSGPALLASLVCTFVGGVLVTYFLLSESARGLYELLTKNDKEEQDAHDGRSPRLR